MVNFTNRSIPAAQSPSLWPCFTGVVRWWPGSSWNTGLGEEKGPAVWAGSLEEVKQREGEGRRQRPGCSMRVDLLAVMLSNSPQRRTAGGKRLEKEQKGADDDEGEGIVFSHQKEAGGGVRERLCMSAVLSLLSAWRSRSGDAWWQQNKAMKTFLGILQVYKLCPIGYSCHL